MVEPVSNTPEISVSELAGALKRTIEDAFGMVRLRGEISGYRGPHSSGHCYFSLKDAGARIDAVIWKGVFSRLRFRPEEGLEVVATGRITTYPGKSSYQIVIEQMEPAGIGALMALLEERKKKLAAEGLFEPARKQLLPYLPEVIGVVTSPTGAVIRDVLHRISDRFPRHVIVWPVRVQGEGSAEEVAEAIRGFNALEPGGALPRPDVLIVARGGGSLEDLWSFNEEIVARAAAESDIPLVSAIGHETDWTILDMVADVRAPTPTAAAEMVVPVRAELFARLRDQAARLAGSALRLRDRRRRDLATLARALPPAERLVELPRQRLDLAAHKCRAALEGRLGRQRLALATMARRLSGQTPAARLARIRERIEGLGARLPGLIGRQRQRAGERREVLARRLETAIVMRITLERRDLHRRRASFEALAPRLPRAIGQRCSRMKERLSAFSKLFGSLNYRQVLARGFAIVRGAEGNPIRTKAAIAQGDGLSLEFADGRISAIAGEASQAEAPKRPTLARPARARPDQGSLF